MVVTGMLAWFDEPPELLDNAVRSLDGFADRLVAYDGGYRLVPGATPESPAEQAAVIRDAADALGLRVTVKAPGRLWDGQVEKRDALLQEASLGSDWVFPLDADWLLAGKKWDARAELENSSLESVIVRFVTPQDPARPPSVTGANYWHRSMIGEQQLPLVYRVMHDMHVSEHHWWYTGRRTHRGMRVNLWGDAGTQKPFQGRFRSDFWIEHHCHFRDLERIQRNREFCEARDRQVAETGAEA